MKTTPANPLFSDEDDRADGIDSVRNILSFLEEQTCNIADLQTGSPQHGYALSSRAVTGQLSLYSLLRETLDQAIARIDAERR